MPRALPTAVELSTVTVGNGQTSRHDTAHDVTNIELHYITLHQSYLEWPKVQILLNHYYTRCAELKAENSYKENDREKR